MDIIYSLIPPGILSQIFVGLSRTTILFIVASGLSLILGVLRIPNVAHGSLYMIGAFTAFTVTKIFGEGQAAFWMALIIAPLFVALISLIAERGMFQFLYEREHLMLLLLTFAFSLVFGDLVKLVWGGEYKSVPVPAIFQGFVPLFGGLPFPIYNIFLLVAGPVVAVLLWLLTNKTKIGKIARAAAVDREMVGAVGINVSWVFAIVFVIGCLLAGLGGVLVAPTVSVTLGMDHNLIIEAFLIVIMGGLGNIWGAMLGALIFGITQSLGILVWPQFGIVFPYLAVVVVLLFRPTGLLKSTW
ncbi:MAG TPA: branched-chain amino acid ABC transporter permease [Syntrophorhabdaceae bacterium]|nr:branched-chain amino acid ABC transporter permease [Syntrophorhabdaceae bacterium]MDI9560212.1 branched-chain amino acid ABC transporter permease [Pseudomonadota bacterium]OQC47806.1 MAG: High-affinity branched-chain amino acid transport system permease protein LivH [Deltaproteobacteria bacterium ADurb.Bin026]MBP8699567.1 branched-chain amino acid ABC transporter permease [Syntrophorhabdaceae bacterium]HNQ62749.1 branched-chain amino acid ABC transporter permease [Syntrophorhabdaceae bacteri